MREVIIPFVSNIIDEEEVPYRVRVIGQQRADGIWEGRIEFTGGEHSRPFCAAIEVTRATGLELEQWATGLTRIALQGALQRARRRVARRVARRAASQEQSEEQRA